MLVWTDSIHWKEYNKKEWGEKNKSDAWIKKEWKELKKELFVPVKQNKWVINEFVCIFNMYTVTLALSDSVANPWSWLLNLENN